MGRFFMMTRRFLSLPGFMKGLRALFLLSALMLAPGAVWAEAGGYAGRGYDNYPCDSAVMTALNDARKNAAAAEQKRNNDIMGSPLDFDKLYCGAQITDSFGEIARMFSRDAIANLVRNVIKNVMNQACQAAVAPLQNAATLACIPRIDLSFTIPNLFANGKRGFCDGFQLLQVSPVTSAPSGGYPMSPYRGLDTGSF